MSLGEKKLPGGTFTEAGTSQTRPWLQVEATVEWVLDSHTPENARHLQKHYSLADTFTNRQVAFGRSELQRSAIVVILAADPRASGDKFSNDVLVSVNGSDVKRRHCLLVDRLEIKIYRI